MTTSRRRVRTIISLAAICAIAGFLASRAVSRSVTDEDREYIAKYLTGIARPPDRETRSYEDEVRFITAVQRAVLEIASGNVGVPEGSEREPKDVFLARSGLCYDRSRVIEKILRSSAFEVRHVAIYSTEPHGSAVRALLKSRSPSHAVSEALTRHGWLVIDSNDPWISLDRAGRPVSMDTIQSRAESGEAIAFREPLPNRIYQRPFTFLYGLYSRHGGFYPPYDPIPDVNYRELAGNLW